MVDQLWVSRPLEFGLAIDGILWVVHGVD